jgi:Ca-activated chloride channel family protein
MYHGKDVLFCIDISHSMLADDIAPNRLERAKYFMQRILAQPPSNTPVGVVLFKGEGVLSVPLTTDREVLQHFIEDVSPLLQTVPGTDIEKGIETAVESFPKDTPAERYIYLFTDGEMTDGDPLALTERVKQQDIRVWTFMVGTEEGAPLDLDSGEVRISRADSAFLNRITDAWDGELFSLADTGVWNQFKSKRGPDRWDTPVSRSVPEDKERYYIFLCIALLGLAVYIGLRVAP